MNDTCNYYFHVLRMGGHMQNGKMQYHSAEMRFLKARSSSAIGFSASRNK